MWRILLKFEGALEEVAIRVVIYSFFASLVCIKSGSGRFGEFGFTLAVEIGTNLEEYTIVALLVGAKRS